MQNVTGDHHIARGVRERSAITTATGDGRIAFVDADDIADVAVHALLDRAAPDTDLVLTGPETLGYDDVVAILSAAAGRQIRHERVDVDVLGRHLTAYLPEANAVLLALADTLLAAGVEDRTTDTVERVTGRRPGHFAEFVGRLPAGALGSAPPPRAQPRRR
jgi:uncharacterized protein YbjT (DUF2867 family)